MKPLPEMENLGIPNEADAHANHLALDPAAQYFSIHLRCAEWPDYSASAAADPWSAVHQRRMRRNYCTSR